MTGVTTLHVSAGLLALMAGAIAATARKGGHLHARFGQAFCVAMGVLGLTAAILSPFKVPAESPVGGLMVCYFVATAWWAARQRSGASGRFERWAGGLMLLLASAIIAHGVEVALAPPGTYVGPPGPIVLFVLGGLCLLAALGDLRAARRGSQTRTQRLVRHLWRMCFAFFIATGSFFLGQQDVLPPAWRGAAVLWLLAFAPFLLMLYWLVRVRLPRARPVMSVLAASTKESP